MLVRGPPPLMDGGVMLPQFIELGALPAAADLGLAGGVRNQIRVVRADKSGDGFPMAFKPKTAVQFIGDKLKIGGALQGHKILKELADLGRPVRPMIPAGEFGAELGTVLEPAGLKPVKVGATDLKVLGSFERFNLSGIELAEDLPQERRGQPFGQLFFSRFKMNPDAPWVEGLRRPPLRSGLLRPSTQGQG